MHWINTHSATDIANKLPVSYLSNQLATKADYISTLTQDKGQFLPDGIMPASGPETSLATEQLVGDVKLSVDLSKTFPTTSPSRSQQQLVKVHRRARSSALTVARPRQPHQFLDELIQSPHLAVNVTGKDRPLGGRQVGHP
ncbi:hypothetical protein PO587_44075 [Streptomyces gilvifuscus]|uniref:Uncharacterized protein n=1 Tax=Streptomyces gilvifuscus TaxID=1550617 RepID=A0ABT5GAA3_9ACTN|nr:hypothetical protein [Streptomyces gilvifuscus]MDC2961421.1 hypothetical protein [Streptomyces gilvifuscus]